MKRPTGYDPTRAAPTPVRARAAEPTSAPPAAAPAGSVRRNPSGSAAASAPPAPSIQPTRPHRPSSRPAPEAGAAHPLDQDDLPTREYDLAPEDLGPRVRLPRATGGVSPRAAARLARRATVRRRRAERAEVRRFTRRSRRRRAGLLVAGSLVLTLLALVAIATFSPLLAVRTIEIEGATRIPQQDIAAALSDQLGTPLPLVDPGRVERELAAFPLIQSYDTESRPPGTLVVRIVERTPVAVVMAGGGFDLVDSAGVTVQSSAVRLPGVPLIDLPSGDRSSASFRAAAAVLVALPAELAAQVDQVSARTTDDVSLVLVGGQRVVWGSAEDSVRKAQHLSLLLRQTPTAVSEYDVSSPGVGIIR